MNRAVVFLLAIVPVCDAARVTAWSADYDFLVMGSSHELADPILVPEPSTVMLAGIGGLALMSLAARSICPLNRRWLASFSSAACRGALLFVVTALFASKMTVAAPFTLDPTESFLTISGVASTANDSQPFVAQSGASLTGHFGGTLLVDLQTPNQLRIVGTSIDGVPQTGPFEPLGAGASYAIEIPDVLASGVTGFSSIVKTFLYGTSSSVVIDGGGDFSAAGFQFRIASNTVHSAAPPLVGPIQVATAAEIVNAAASSANLTQVGDQYRIAIPFQAQATLFVGIDLNVEIAGQFVGYRPVIGASAPDLVNGGFEDIYTGPGSAIDGSTTGWTNVPGTLSDNFAAIQNPNFGDRL